MGGIVGIEPGTTGWMDSDLAPGEYVLICFFPDPSTGNLPHAVAGMVQQITVT